MSIILVFIEQNYTFNMEVLRLCLSLSSGHLSACLIWHRVDTALGHPGKLSQGCPCYLFSTFRSYISQLINMYLLRIQVPRALVI